MVSGPHRSLSICTAFRDRQFSPPARFSAELTSRAFSMAGLGVLPPVRLRHHSVITAHPPATCGAACDVPVSEVYWSIVAAGLAGSGLPVPGIGVKAVDVRENA